MDPEHPQILPVIQPLADLAARGIWIGTDSWNYPGWDGIIYDMGAYTGKTGRRSDGIFREHSLQDYGKVFRTACYDASFYSFPDGGTVEHLRRRMPENFRLAMKAPEAVTCRTWPKSPRLGARAGQRNKSFLDAALFVRAFLEPLEPIRHAAGPIIFQFPAFTKSDFSRGADFVTTLEPFLAALPKAWRYAVEIRNKTFLHADYFAALRRHGVAHSLTNWDRMPSIGEQMAAHGDDCFPAGFICARYLMTPGTKYAAAVKAFEPFSRIQKVDTEARASLRRLILRAQAQGREAFLFVNNRLEGCAPLTIADVVEQLPK